MTSRNKPTKKLSWLRVILVILLLIVVAFGGFFGTKWYMEQNNNPLEGENASSDGSLIVSGVTIGEIPEEKWSVPPDMPKYLSIPSIGINNAKIESLGTKAGTASQFDDPVYSDDAGWYNLSAKPGSGYGVGIYDGHYGIGSYQAVFTNLAKVSLHDEIIIERGDGEKFTYMIIENETILAADIDMAEMIQSFNPNKEGIILITCAGTWDVNAQKYDQRTIIRAAINQ